MNDCIVYKHTSPSGKVYIGITTQEPQRRWRIDGSGYRQNVHFCQARTGWHHTEDTKKKMSELAKDRPQSFFDSIAKNLTNYRQSDKGKAEMSIRSKKLWENEEFRKKNTAHLYGNHYRRKAVVCIETGDIYETVTLAAKSIGKTREAVGRCCRNSSKTSGGYHWRFADE